MMAAREDTYLVPDYYACFACKGGTCRNTCCRGWPITISMEEYFRLLGVSCSARLRRKLDCAFHLVEHPDRDRYAAITPNWEGACPMLAEDGLCMLHKELGPEALPSVCRIYPRSPKHGFESECSCSGSCEAVLELFLHRQQPIQFMQQAILLDEPCPQTLRDERTKRFYKEVRRRTIQLMQTRQVPLFQRLVLLGLPMQELHTCERNGNFAQMEDAMERWTVENVLLRSTPKPNAPENTNASPWEILRIFSEDSLSLLPYWNRIHEAFPHMTGERYRDLCNGFAQRFPSWEIFLEHVLVNHVFYAGFPFSDKHDSLWDEYVALCACYFLAKCAAVLYTAVEPAQEALVDVVAAVLRMAEHTSFGYASAVLYRQLGLAEPGALCAALRDV